MRGMIYPRPPVTFIWNLKWLSGEILPWALPCLCAALSSSSYRVPLARDCAGTLLMTVSRGTGPEVHPLWLWLLTWELTFGKCDHDYWMIEGGNRGVDPCCCGWALSGQMPPHPPPPRSVPEATLSISTNECVCSLPNQLPCDLCLPIVGISSFSSLRILHRSVDKN